MLLGLAPCPRHGDRAQTHFWNCPQGAPSTAVTVPVTRPGDLLEMKSSALVKQLETPVTTPKTRPRASGRL